MSERSTSKVVRYIRDKLPPDKTDWARLDAMTDDEAVAAARSDPEARLARACTRKSELMIDVRFWVRFGLT
jgi:hypothetical protein